MTRVGWYISNHSTMSHHTYKKVEVVGTSPKSFEDAINGAIQTANQSIRNLRWFEVVEQRGAINDGKVAEYQVTLKVCFTIESGNVG